MLIRPAQKSDSTQCAEIHMEARGRMSYVPTVHTRAETLAWMQEGVGSALLRRILEQAPAELELRVFEQNAGAIRFYERSGFVTVSRTDEDNEERLPNRLMRRSR
jgi:GNAT superfamily N-acetyltransferase